MNYYNVPCYRIKALKDFGDVSKGDLGGFISHESNLSLDGDCWVYDGIVTGNAKISGNAKVTNNTIITQDVEIGGDFVISSGGTYCGKFCASKGTSTIAPVSLLNTGRDVFISDGHIAIGCYEDTIAAIKSVTLEEAATIASNSGFNAEAGSAWWSKYKDIVISLAEKHAEEV